MSLRPWGGGVLLAVPNTTTTFSLSSPQVRTLFVSGLPMDVRLRELYLLFRCYQVRTSPRVGLSAVASAVFVHGC